MARRDSYSEAYDAIPDPRFTLLVEAERAFDAYLQARGASERVRARHLRVSNSLLSWVTVKSISEPEFRVTGLVLRRDFPRWYAETTGSRTQPWQVLESVEEFLRFAGEPAP